MFWNFSNKIIRWIHFDKKSKKFVKMQISTFRLNDRSNTQNQSIEK